MISAGNNSASKIGNNQRPEPAMYWSNEKLFREAFNCNPIPMSIRTIQGQFIEVNPAFLESFNLERSEIIGSNIEKLYSRSVFGAQHIMEKWFKEQEGLGQFEAQFRMKSGEIRVFLVSAQTCSIGAETFVLGIYKDITDHKRIEEALLFSEDRFFKAYNASPLIMSVTAFEDGRFISVNDSFCRFLGYARNEILGRTSSQLGFWFYPNQRNQVKKMIKNYLTVRDMQIHFTKMSGEVRQGLYSAELIDIRGETCLLNILTDITEQFRLAEEQQKLQENINKVCRLLMSTSESASIAHEITQPINAIKLLVESALYRYNSHGSADAVKLIETLRNVSFEVNKIEGIIKQIHSFTRKGQVLDFSPCNLNEAVRIVIDSFKSSLSASGIVIRQNLLKSLPDITGIKNWLVTMVRNLIENAIQALTSVEKNNKKIYCFTRLIQDKVVLEVIDNATGISNEQMSLIFQPFYSTKDIEHNMGLGLSIVDSIVTSFGGRINVFNNDIGGTTFRVELPVWDHQVHYETEYSTAVSFAVDNISD